MNANTDKCHLLVTDNYETSANIGEFEIESSKKEKLLDISIDIKFSFEHLFVNRPVKSCMRLQEYHIIWTVKNEDHQWKHLKYSNLVTVP